MPVYLALRLASILGVALMSKMVPNPQTWLTIVYSVGFSHYLLGAIYSRQQFREVYAQPLSLFPVLALAIFGIGLYSLQFPLLIFFALHHAFNEAYVLKETTPEDDSAISPFRSSAFMLHLFLYFILLRRSQSLGIIELNIFYLVLGSGGQGVFSSELLWGGLLVSYILFVYCLWQLKPLLKLQILIDNCGFELLGLGAVALSYYVQFQFLQIVLYHFVFWMLYPIVKMRRFDGRGIAGYIGIMGIVTGSVLVLSPIGGTVHGFSLLFYQQQFKIWSYIHITASFMLSNANPAWIVSLFRPAAKPRAGLGQSLAGTSEAGWPTGRIASVGRG